MMEEPVSRDGFTDRREAGRVLAGLVTQENLTDPVVLGVPRGGVVVAYEVAAALGAPLQAFVARKLAAPQLPEVAIGAIAEDGRQVIDRRLVRTLGLSAEQLESVLQRDSAEVQRRVARYRGGRPLPRLTGRSVVLVDDGLATGSTAAVALSALRAKPRRLLLAVPVCARQMVALLERIADRVVCPQCPTNMSSISSWYRDFTQTTDEEVCDLLAAAAAGARQ